MSNIKKLFLVFLLLPAIVVGCGKSSGDSQDKDKSFFGDDLDASSTISAFDLVVADGRFQIFEESLLITNLDRNLDRQGPYTVFAPTDAAFERLPSRVRRALDNNRSLLRQVLMYHIVEREYSDSELRNQFRVRTMLNENIRVRRINGNLYVDDARITQVNGRVGNGVVHVIDEVLIPPSLRFTLGL